MARFDLIENFISEEERLQLVKWFNDNLDNRAVFRLGVDAKSKVRDYPYRLTTRGVRNVPYPFVAYKIFERIMKAYAGEAEGMIAVATLPKGDTFNHVDPMRGTDGRHSLTLNVLVQGPESGGELTLDGEVRRVEERDLTVWCPTLYKHSVSRVEGSRNRYMWIFRLLVDDIAKWEVGTGEPVAHPS